jgi:hypothetical protein
LSVAIRSPTIFLTPLMEISSVVPVAMAMLPVKVEQLASPEASPAFWMVVVPEMLHEAAGEVVSDGASSASAK